MNNNRKRIISVTDGLVKYGLLIQRIVDCFKFYEYNRYDS